MRRRRVALLMTLAVAATAGCVGPFGDSAIPDEQLGEPAAYDWDVGANATYTLLTNGTYRAVYRLGPTATDDESATTGTDDDAAGTATGDEAATGQGAETRTLELHRRDGLGQRRPLEIRALRYRYPNGTVVNGTALDARTGDQRTTVTLPAGPGMVAYTAASPPKRFRTVVFVEGAHEVILPPDRRVDNPIFGHVSPPTDDRTWTGENRRVLRWDEVDRDRIAVRYYQQRDLTLFAGFVALGLVVGAVAAGIVYRQIRRLRAEHEALDADLDRDDSGRDPPPGLR